MLLVVNSLKKGMKFFLFASLVLLNGCFVSPLIAPGFYAGAADVGVKSKELITGSECKWRCYKKKKVKISKTHFKYRKITFIDNN